MQHSLNKSAGDLMKAFNFSVQKYTKNCQWSTQFQEISQFKFNGMAEKSD